MAAWQTAPPCCEYSVLKRSYKSTDWLVWFLMDWVLAFFPHKMHKWMLIGLLRYVLKICKDSCLFCCDSNILQVLGRTSRQVKQLRRGLKETLIWPLLTERKDTIPLLFPRMSDMQCTPQVNAQTQTILAHGSWFYFVLESESKPSTTCSPSQERPETCCNALNWHCCITFPFSYTYNVNACANTAQTWSSWNICKLILL